MNTKRLLEILSWVRPDGTESESKFVDWLEGEIKGLGYHPVFDAYGNIWVEHERSETLLTCHTDTVHSRKTGKQRQELVVDEHGIINLKHKEQGFVLGADDGAGVAILLDLLANEVPVSFVFFRSEEVGGIGSQWAADNLAERMSRYKRAVAFDRKGKTSVITYQGSKCCSDEFALALAAQINANGKGLNFVPDDSGVFTDTANLTHLIPECTNISVGYESAHSFNETLDSGFLADLIDSLKKVYWEGLPVCRDVKDHGYSPAFNTCYGGRGYDYAWDYVPAQGDFAEVSEEQLQEELHYLTVAGREYAEDLVYFQPDIAIELLVRLSEGR